MAFDFIDVTDAAPSTVIVSEPASVSGLTLGTKAVTVVGAGEFQIDGGAWGTTGVVQNGSELTLRLTTPAGELGAVTTMTINVVSIGYVTWSVTNKNNLLTETGVSSDTALSFRITPAQPFSDVAVGTDTLIPETYIVVAEVADIGDAMYPQTTSRVTLLEVGKGAGTGTPIIEATVLEVGNGVESVLPAIVLLMTEAGVSHETLFSTLLTSFTVTNQGQGVDWVNGTSTVVLSSSATGVDVLLLSNGIGTTVSETGSGLDWLEFAQDAYTLIKEYGTGYDTPLPNSLVFEGYTENAVGKDQLIYSNEDRMAHVFNVRLAAYSSWQNLEVSEVFSLNGKLFGIAPDGLYQLNGAGTDAEVYTGLLDLKSQKIKHVPNMYITAASEQPMRVAVNSVSQGEEVFEYEARPSTVETPAPTRVKLGKGLRSTYFGVVIGNTGAAKTQVGDVSFVVAETDRRI